MKQLKPDRAARHLTMVSLEGSGVSEHRVCEPNMARLMRSCCARVSNFSPKGQPCSPYGTWSMKAF